MRNFFRRAWRVITFPFRLIVNVIAYPFRAGARFHRYLNTEPEERPLAEVLADLATDKNVRQMMWDQVEAFRRHLLRSVLVLALTVGISFLFTEKIVQFLAIPVGGLDKLKAIEVTESIGVFMRVALLAGIGIASPWIAFEFWLFAAPGLRPREKKMGLAGIPLASIFFLGGMAFTYYAMLPTALPFLVNFMGIQAELRPQSYFGFVTGLMFWIGVFFQFPLVIYVLTAIGLIKPRALLQQWRLAVVIIAIVAAAVTPTVDPVNMGLVMAPMILLYFISIGLSFLAYAGRRKAPHATP